MKQINGGYAICFNEWLFDKEIKNELHLLLLISSLCARDGVCYASNTYFAEKFNAHEVTISQKIKKLEQHGYIVITYQKRGCEILKREIRLAKILTDDLRKDKSTISEKTKENNTSINNTSINNITPYNPPMGDDGSFEKFWRSYIPVKVKSGRVVDKGSKKLALRAWQKALKVDIAENIIKGLEEYLMRCAQNDILTCQASVFLNQEKWKHDDCGVVLSSKTQEESVGAYNLRMMREMGINDDFEGGF